ncbi:hypothetical protein ACSBR2_042062 [Camellia fascicularis]
METLQHPTSRRSEMRIESTPHMGSRDRLLHLHSPTTDLPSLSSSPIRQATRQHWFPNSSSIVQRLPDGKPHNLDTIYDRLIVPMLRKLTKKEDGITILQKMGVGMVIAVFTMIVSAIVEKERRTLALTRPTLGIEPRKGEISSMSGLWLIAQLTLAGFSEAFTIIVYRATGGAGKGNWLPEDLNKGRLDYFYYLIDGLEVLNLGYFLVCAKWYKYKGASLNVLYAKMLYSSFRVYC